MDDSKVYSRINWLNHDDPMLRQLRQGQRTLLNSIRIQQQQQQTTLTLQEGEGEDVHPVMQVYYRVAEWMERDKEFYNLTELMHFMVPHHIKDSDVIPEPLVAAFLSALLFMGLLGTVLLLLTLCFYFTYYHQRSLARESEI
ncbi:uncharacterized protein LOC134840425 [Symsagittifera roscoffensis]|uniref:uncharacterized protein LOC134840425 n=1 Tax=Symsagittifera roscoffensis TaxID=84072 RepID=UPI00307C2F2F